ncbi:MAG: hypothetical protein AAF393_10230 [Pseudomonadota bacterium]
MHDDQRRGGTPVGYLHEFAAPEAQAICMLRHWCIDGEAGLHNYLSEMTPSKQTQTTVDVMSQIGSVLSQYGRRPLLRHDTKCQCVGGDEACFATMISAAADGAREDAVMLACLMVRADMTPVLVSLAARLGHALKSRVPVSQTAMRPANAVLH